MNLLFQWVPQKNVDLDMHVQIVKCFWVIPAQENSHKQKKIELSGMPQN